MDGGLEMHIFGTRLRFTFGFFAVWAMLFAQSGGGKVPQTALLCCLLHETGHLAAMKLTGLKVSSMTFYSGGISLESSPPTELAGTFREIIVLISGCLVNLLLFFLGSAAGNRLFALINLALFLFNLLPFSSLDGGRLIKSIFSEICPQKDISAALRLSDMLFGLCFCVFLIKKGCVSFTLPLAMGMIIAEGLWDRPK